MTIAEAIKKYRFSQGLTQIDLAIKIDRSVRCVKRYEKGDTIPKGEVLEKIFDTPFHDVVIRGLAEKGVI